MKQLQKSVNQIKDNRVMGRKYMLLEEIRKEEHDAGYEQGTIEVHHNHIMSFLSGLAPVPENLKNQVISTNNSVKINREIRRKSQFGIFTELGFLK